MPASFGAAGQLVERGVAFAEGDDVLEVVDDGQQVAEAPDAGLIDRQVEVRRSCQSQRRALGLGRRLSGRRGSSAGCVDVTTRGRRLHRGRCTAGSESRC